MKKLLLNALCIGLLSSNAFAMSPTIMPIDMGDKAGKKIECEGILYQASDSSSCAGTEKGCTMVLVDDCKPLKLAQAVNCTTSAPDSAFMEHYKKLNLPTLNDVESSVIKTLQYQYPYKWPEERNVVYSDEYKAEFAKQWAERTHVKIEGTLESCSTCENCYPASHCEVSKCTAEIKEPAAEKGK